MRFTPETGSLHTEKKLPCFQKEDGSPSAGMRLDYPDFLGYTFRSLDWYGRDLKNRFGQDFRQNIHFDDDRLSLCMDIRLPGSEKWDRISAELAIEEKKAFDEENEIQLKSQLRRPGARRHSERPKKGQSLATRKSRGNQGLSPGRQHETKHNYRCAGRRKPVLKTNS